MAGGREDNEVTPYGPPPEGDDQRAWTAPTLTVRTLGDVIIRWKGRELRGASLRKTEALLIYLAVNPGQQSRSRLAGLLWGSLPEKRARSNLRHALWSLRQDLGAAGIESDRLSIGIGPDLDRHVDVLEFEKALGIAARCQRAGAAETGIEHLQTAVALYDGDFLDAFDLPDCREFEEWAMWRRVSLRERALAALTTLVAHHTRRGSYEEALTYARQQLSLDPWREEAHRDVMRLLALTGQRSASLAQYETCRRLLETELGLEPLEETTALYERLLRWDSDRFSPQDHQPSADLTVCLPFAGRGEEQSALVDWWRSSRRGGKRRLALIEGEAGVGKTRLVEEVLDYVRAEGTVVLRGQCYEFGTAVPYQPMAEALRAQLRDRPMLVDKCVDATRPTNTGAVEREKGIRANVRISPAPRLPLSLSPVWLSELSRLLPEIRQAFPDLPEPVYVSGEAARQRLFEAVARFLSHQDTDSLLLFIDDLQWADRSTLDLLHYLVRQPDSTAISIIGTYRPEEVDLTHPLTRLRQGLGRDGVAERLTLEPLLAEAVEDIAQSLVGDEEGTALGGFLYRESEGNPFILTEVVNSLEEEGALSRLPDGAAEWRWSGWSGAEIVSAGVRDIVLQRVGRLTEAAQRLLSLASVVGWRLTVPLLEMAAGRDADGVEDSVEEWLSRRLVRPRPSRRPRGHSDVSRYDFSHDKIRTVVYETVGVPTRRNLHRRVAEALEGSDSLRAEERDQVLAHHWDQASEPARAVLHHLRAGDQARLVYAHQAAIEHYDQALEALQDQGAHEKAAQTLMKLGLTYYNAYDFGRARRAYDEAFALRQSVRTWVRSATEANAMGAASSRTLRVRWAEPSTLDPGLVADGHTGFLVAHLFSGLVDLGPDLDVLPDVALRWEMSQGGRRFIFYLRDDVVWSDGRAVTAGDFEYAWRRVLDPSVNSPAAGFLYDLKGSEAYHRGQVDIGHLGVRAADDVTLCVELERPVGYFLQLLTHAAYRPVPRHALETHGEKWTEGDLIGNGPFRLADWEQGQRLLLVRNRVYHGRFGGNLERVEIKLSVDESARLDMYRSGELDVLGIGYLPAAEREEARLKHTADYTSGPRLETCFAAFDVTRPPFDDLRVRRAFAMATDRTALANVVLHGYAAPADGGFVPPGMAGHSAGIGLPYDPERARELLADAGYRDGHGFPTVEALAFRAGQPRTGFLTPQWAEVLGVEVAWTVLPWAEFLREFATGTYHMVLLMWTADYPDPDNFLRVCREKAWGRWRNETFEKLVGEARQVMDPEERMRRYREAECLLTQDVPILPLTYERDHLLVKPWVSRYPTSVMQAAFWKEAVVARPRDG